MGYNLLPEIEHENGGEKTANPAHDSAHNSAYAVHSLGGAVFSLDLRFGDRQQGASRSFFAL